jgi:hypothetical protein
VKRFLLLLIIFGFFSCGDKSSSDNKKINAEDTLSLDEKSAQYFHEPEMATYHLFGTREGVFTPSTFTLGLSCDNVYGTGQTGDWTQNNVQVNTSVSIPAGKNCRITLTSYYDGTNTYSAVLTSLVTTVSTTGTITSSAAAEYNSGGTMIWIYSSQAATYSIQYNYSSNAITATTSITPTVITIQTVALAISGCTAPAVSGLTLYSLGAINSAAATYTLVATVTGATGCKYIDNSNSTYSPTSWNSVNNAYNAATNTCPSFTPASNGSTTGNWTNEYGGSGPPAQKTLIIWYNICNGINAYTTANF